MPDLVLPATLAAYDPLGMLGPDIGPPSMTGHDGVIVHTMAGSFVGTDAFFHDGGWVGTESHVGVAGSGFAKQWVPWNRRADANLDGNPRYLSIEDADIGESFPPASTASDESPPLTDAQVLKIIDLCVYWCDVRNHQQCPSSWTCHQVGIPAVWIGTSCDRGIGVHRHGIDPWRTQWGGADCPKFSLTDGKICPRSVRLRQVRDRIVPAVQARLNQEPDLTPEQNTELFRIGDRLQRVETDLKNLMGGYVSSAFDGTKASGSGARVGTRQTARLGVNDAAQGKTEAGDPDGNNFLDQRLTALEAGVQAIKTKLGI